MTQISRIDPAHLSAAWQDVLQGAVRRASHDVKDALNGVSVNLEVIRSRAARADAPASSLSQFSEAATQQLDRLTDLVDSILALSRQDRDPVDLVPMVKRISILLNASTKAGAPRIACDASQLVGSAATSVPCDAARIVVATVLQAALSHNARGTAPLPCVLGSAADVITVSIGGEIADDDLRDVEAYGVSFTRNTHEIVLRFPHA